MKKGKDKQTENFLDYRPFHSPRISCERDEEGMITILWENKGLFNRLLQLLIKKPKVSQIHLDDYGSFVWELMDKSRTIHEIGLELKNKYGEDAEPLYERLVRFIKTLKDCGFIEYL